MRRGSIAAIAALCWSAALSAADAPPGQVTMVLKFVKRSSAAAAAPRFDPASCRVCTPVATPLYNADNARETVIALAVPRRRSLALRFTGARDAIRRVLLESGDLAFRQERDAIVVDLPPLKRNAITAAEVATHIVEPGMVLRFEHADPARRAGAYATGRFPQTERLAADALEFAQREVIRELGLGEEAERRNLGRIQVMGFDTNAPHNHVDTPPHIHMHLRWPRNAGTQIGHFYIGIDGLLTHNLAGVSGVPDTERRFDRGDTFTTIGPDGRGLYFHRITPKGWLEIGRPGGRACLIRPVGDGGFQAGAIVQCAGAPAHRLTVKDDIVKGILTVTTDDLIETFRYDPDNGEMSSPTMPPPATPSAFVSDEVVDLPPS